MKKRKTYEISVIDKTYSKIISDETKFYTSDTSLELWFELKETEYTFESAEIVLLNIDDRSLVTRAVTKSSDSFTYELDDDIIAHYGDWRGQLRFEQAGETYVSSPVKFRIENDLSNDRPPQLSDVQSWVSLKRYADSLTDELKQAVLSVEGVEDTFNENELERQNQFTSAEQSRQDIFETNESERDRTFESNETTRQSQELERENSEDIRQTVFDENEANRTETFNDNEATRQENEETRKQGEQERQSAELIRVENENQRILNYENMQETIDMIGKVKLVNDIDVSITANGDREITKTPELNKADDNIRNYLKNNIVVGDKYYISIEVKSKGESGTMQFYSGGSDGFNYTSTTTSNEYKLASRIVNGIFNFALVRLINITGKPQATDLVYRKVYTINLTKAFGKGNEPTKEIMDWIVSENDYFDSLLLKRYDLQQYEINQLRKAVLALGGTI